MNDFDIMTCGDQKYFKFLKIFEKNVFNRYHFFPIIYDLGLTEAQKNHSRVKLRINSHFPKFLHEKLLQLYSSDT